MPAASEIFMTAAQKSARTKLLNKARQDKEAEELQSGTAPKRKSKVAALENKGMYIALFILRSHVTNLKLQKQVWGVKPEPVPRDTKKRKASMTLTPTPDTNKAARTTAKTTTSHKAAYINPNSGDQSSSDSDESEPKVHDTAHRKLTPTLNTEWDEADDVASENSQKGEIDARISESELLSSGEEDIEDIGGRLKLERPKWAADAEVIIPKLVARGRSSSRHSSVSSRRSSTSALSVSTSEGGFGSDSNNAMLLPKRKTANKSKGKKTKHAIVGRKLKQSGETPTWATPAPSQRVKTEDQIEHLPTVAKVPADHSVWPLSTAIVSIPGKLLAVLSQSDRIKAVLRQSIKTTLIAVVFSQGFPDSEERTVITRDSILTASKELGYDDIVSRAEVDTMYLHEMAKVADDRISTLRRNLKTSCAQQVQAFFELHNGCADRVTALLDAQNYIFPGDFMNPQTLKKHMPFQHPIFAAVIRQMFYQGRKSFGAVNVDQLFNSMEGGDPRDVEMNPAMLSLVAAALHAAILDWDGGYHKDTDFSHESSADVYETHFNTLKAIFESNPAAYHRLMATIYEDASGKQRVAHKVRTAVVDLASMPV